MRIIDWSSDVCSSDLRTLHRTAEGDATFELIGNALADQLGVDLGLANLDDVQRHVAARQVAQLLAQLFDVGTLLADDDARTGGIDRHAAQLRRPLDHDLRDQIGSAQVRNPVTNAHLVCRLLLEQTNINKYTISNTL